MTPERDVHYVDSGGLEIAYEVLGDGPIDIITLFEWGCSRDLLWDNPRAERAGIGRLIRFDIRGTGLEFEDRGERDLKGVPGAWRVLAVV